MIGERIQILRNNKKMTQVQLAKALKISKSSISAYERDERVPTADVIISLAKYFNVSTDFILGLIRKEVSLTQRKAQSEMVISIPEAIMGNEVKIKEYHQIQELLFKNFK